MLLPLLCMGSGIDTSDTSATSATNDTNVTNFIGNAAGDPWRATIKVAPTYLAFVPT